MGCGKGRTGRRWTGNWVARVDSKPVNIFTRSAGVAQVNIYVFIQINQCIQERDVDVADNT